MFLQLENLCNYIDKSFETIICSHPEEVRCKKGCSDCCHAIFDISFIEAARIASFLSQNGNILEDQQERAKEAAQLYEEVAQGKLDPSKGRIRCPLLAADDLCLAHQVRPINCRTYGVPTLINQMTHVCGLSQFKSNQKYPTLDLAPLQNSLQDYSITLVGEEFGKKRFPIAWVFLKLDYFLPV